MSVRVHPFAAPIASGGTPKSEIVCIDFSRSSKLLAGFTPASSKTFALYQTSDLFAPFTHTPYRVLSTVPSVRQIGA